MKRQILSFLIIVHFSFPVIGQDTISIFFQTGFSKIEDPEFEKLNSIPSLFELSDMDSVHYIGMADSIGNTTSNFKLSEKRAKNVEKYCRKLIPQTIPFKSFALGETVKNNDSNRRVDIVLFFETKSKETAEPIDTIISLNNSTQDCFYIDYALLHRSHLRIITKQGGQYVLVETNSVDVKDKNYFYAVENKNGETVAQPVKWKNKRTGNLWWAEKRQVATIPKLDFDKFKIFNKAEPPCNDCNETLTKKGKLIKEDTCKQVDRFLMANIQVKRPIFWQRKVQVRAPREYVNLDYDYYSDCLLRYKIKWTTKKGRKNSNYYFTQLERFYFLTNKSYYMRNIIRVMDCCKGNPEPSECDVPKYKLCELRFCGCAGFKEFSLYAEGGYTYQQNKHIPYGGIVLYNSGFNINTMWFVGTDVDLSLLTFLRYQYNFLTIPTSVLNPVSAWETPAQGPSYSKYIRLYIGSELKTRLYNKNFNYLQHQFLLGISYLNDEYAVPRYFIQGGIGLDYFNLTQPVYSFVQAGIIIRLLHF